MDSKVEMIETWESGLYGKIELARMYGVSRPTDKWIGRYEAKGIGGLEDRSPRPKSSPKAISNDGVRSDRGGDAQTLVLSGRDHPGREAVG